MKAKNIKSLIAIVLLCFVFILSQTSMVSAFSVRELLGLEKPATAESTDKQKKQVNEKSKTEKTNTEWAKTSEEAAAVNPQLDLSYFTLLINNMNLQEREQILANPDLFKQLVENEANNRSTVSAAISNKLEQDINVQFLMRRGAENILRESYLNRLIAGKLPADFPNQDQIKEYYETNKDQFVVPERVHVWQIFFQKKENITDKEIAALKKKANEIVSKLIKGKADFSNVALSQSEHAQSKALGGYMGLIKTNDLIPEMKTAILKLKESEISKPVESESGVHILKRGEILKPEPVELAQVEDQIKNLLINQAGTQLRNAVYVQARKEFPQAIEDKKIEEWRLRLKTNTNN